MGKVGSNSSFGIDTHNFSGRYRGHQEGNQRPDDICDYNSYCATVGVNTSELNAAEDVTEEDAPWDSVLDVYRAQINALPLDPIISKLLL
jgi:hypothetical protein